jgi:hypothetical protein
MSKKNDTIAIEAGKPIKVSADSRPDTAKQLADLRAQAEAEGLTASTGGFIEYNAAGDGKFSAVITFVKL